MNKDGYPNEAELEKITAWPHTDFCELMTYVRGLWLYENYFTEEDNDKYHISTGGWSGHEEIIGALKSNRMFWILCWEQSRRGGHYIFDLSDSRRLHGESSQ